MRVRSRLRFSVVVHFRAVRIFKSSTGSGDDFREYIAKGWSLKYFILLKTMKISLTISIIFSNFCQKFDRFRLLVKNKIAPHEEPVLQSIDQESAEAAHIESGPWRSSVLFLTILTSNSCDFIDFDVKFMRFHRFRRRNHTSSVYRQIFKFFE